MAPQIPVRVKLAVAIAAAPPGSIKCAETQEIITPEHALNGDIRFDHRPDYESRPVDPETLKRIPPANDPDAIDLVTRKGHDIRSFGKGGEKRATTLNSDAHKRAKSRRLQETSGLAEPTRKFKRNWPKRGFRTNKDGGFKKPFNKNAVRRT